jgi:hypothetical protein
MSSGSAFDAERSSLDVAIGIGNPYATGSLWLSRARQIFLCARRHPRDVTRGLRLGRDAPLPGAFAV